MARVDKNERVVPVMQRPRRGVLRWIMRVLLGVILLLLLLVVAGAGYQWFASAADRRAYPPPGELVDVGGHRLHIVCMGEGSPTVILDALGDGTSAQWGWVQPAVAQTTRVCAYDRAGRGWSEVGPPPRDARTAAEELHTLLVNAGIEGPTLMVGHSFGAVVGRIYTDLYPEEVAGLVWIDPGLPGLRSDRMPPEAHAQAAADMELMNVAPLMARLGIFRLIGIKPSLPEPQNSYAQAFYASNALWDSLWADTQTLSLSDAQVEATGSVGDRPLLIISATNGWVNPNGPADESRRIFNTMQQELLTLSTNSKQVLVEGASHASLVMEQAHAAQTTDAIVQVVEAVRNGTRLSP
jgi:pimeloyl-ACP methyl ester carboxylesterase